MFTPWQSPAPLADAQAAPLEPAPRPALNQLSLEQAILHGSRCDGGGPGDRSGALLAAAEACAKLVGARLQLHLALNTQERIERLLHLARGRAQAEGRGEGEGRGLGSVAGEMRRSVSEAMGHWWREGVAFTRATRLLPTQLDPQASHPGPLSAAQQQELISRYARSESDIEPARFEALLAAYAAAHRRCQVRLVPAQASLERCRRAEADGWREPAGLGLFRFEAYLSRQALLAAEVERAVAQHALQAVAGGHRVPPA